MTIRCEVAIVGSGFAGSITARMLAALGYDVVLLERATHPRFAIGESTTPLANLSLERLGRRYGMPDCWRMAAHGRWLAHLPDVRRGLKRGFTFYRHHPGEPFADRGLGSERLLVAASPDDAVSDSHWLRADVDHHFVREAVRAGVDYHERVRLTGVEALPREMRLTGDRDGVPIDVRASFVVDASGPGGFLARHLPIECAIDSVRTRSALVYGHFDNVRPMGELVPSLPAGPYSDDWAAVHHLLDDGWMYALRFDHGATSAGVCLSPDGLMRLGGSGPIDPRALWRAVLDRYPTLADAFIFADELRPLAYVPRMQHRLATAAGERWALLPHAFAFVDPLFSTGIAWGLRAVERLGLMFEAAAPGRRYPAPEALARYAALLDTEADQIDMLVAGAYEAMRRFDLFAAHAMLYFAIVSWSEVRQRLVPDDASAWSGFLGVGDEVSHDLPRLALDRLDAGAVDYDAWVRDAIAPRNVAGLADPARHNLYPVDLDVLIERHSLLGMTREQLTASLPALRGLAPEPAFRPPVLDAGRATWRPDRLSPAPGTPARH